MFERRVELRGSVASTFALLYRVNGDTAGIVAAREASKSGSIFMKKHTARISPLKDDDLIEGRLYLSRFYVASASHFSRVALALLKWTLV